MSYTCKLLNLGPTSQLKSSFMSFVQYSVMLCYNCSTVGCKKDFQTHHECSPSPNSQNKSGYLCTVETYQSGEYSAQCEWVLRCAMKAINFEFWWCLVLTVVYLLWHYMVFIFSGLWYHKPASFEKKKKNNNFLCVMGWIWQNSHTILWCKAWICKVLLL